MKEDISVLGLATIRRNRGISLEQIAESTKISIRSLAAIEQGEFQKLPGGIYNTSYIRQYARAIDYDESAILSYYHRAVGATENPSSPDGRNGRGFVSGYRPASSILGS
jgi:cytoskeletal protein RodZ